MAKKKRALADMLLGYLWNLQQAQELNQLSDEEQAAAAQNLWGSVMDLREQLERLQGNPLFPRIAQLLRLINDRERLIVDPEREKSDPEVVAATKQISRKILELLRIVQSGWQQN